jgi:multisubunit Na+/H+ antiporter MnhE subunit
MMRAWKAFKLSMVASCSILVLVWFMLSSTPSLSTFGYPQGVAVVSQPAALLSLLQDYNRALVRTTEVVYWLLFIIVWWLISSLHSFAKALVSSRRDSAPPSDEHHGA